MRILILLLCIIGQIQSLTAQTTVKEVKPPKLKGDLDCVYRAKYSSKQRSQFYPFNISDTIKLVSFRFHRNNYPIKGDSVIIDSLIEIRTLTKIEINTLTDILYNNFYKQDPNYGIVTQCYFPRNAILFYDKEGHLKESILLYFHCDRHEESSEKIDFGSDCTQKMEKLRKFFVSIGVKFGTDTTIYTYPGENSDE